MMKSKFLLLTFGFTFLLFTFALTCFAQQKIIAIVNNDIITQKDLDDFVNFTRLQLAREYPKAEVEKKINQIKLDLVLKLIDDRLVLQEAKREKITIDESRLEGRINEIRKQYRSEVELQEDLGRQGLTMSDIETKVREQMFMYYIIDLKVRSRIVVSPEEITKFYNENINEFCAPEKRKFETITLADVGLAKTFLRSLRNGENLDDLIAKYPASTDTIEVSKAGELRKDIEEAVSKLKIGDMSEPVEVKDRYVIFKLVGTIPACQMPLSQVQDKIQSLLHDQKSQENLLKWLDELKSKSYIKILQN